MMLVYESDITRLIIHEYTDYYNESFCDSRKLYQRRTENPYAKVKGMFTLENNLWMAVL